MAQQDEILKRLNSLLDSETLWSESEAGQRLLVRTLNEVPPAVPIRTSKKLWVRLGAVGVVATAAALTTFLTIPHEQGVIPADRQSIAATGSESSADATTGPPAPQTAATRPVGYFFDTAEQLIANSQVIFRGEVTQIPNGEYRSSGVAPRILRVRIIEVLFDPSAVASSVASVPYGTIGSDGQVPIGDEEVQVAVGDQVLVFGAKDSRFGSDYFVPVGVPAVLKVVEGRIQTEATDGFARRVDGTSYPEFRGLLDNAIITHMREPLNPLPGGPSPR